MIRIFLAGLGLGITGTLLVAALTGTTTCISLSFIAGMGFLAVVELLAGWGLYIAGKKLGWITVFTPDHSQPLDEIQPPPP